MTEVALFDGTRRAGALNDAFVLGTTDELGLVGRDFTVEAWVKIAPHDTSVFKDLMVLGSPWKNRVNEGLHLGLRHRRLYLGFLGNDTAGARELRADRWYHLAWRYAGRTQTVFVNGITDAFNGGRTPFAGAGLELRLGMAHDPFSTDREGFAGSDGFAGRISELRIWDHGVAERQILERWTRRLTGDEPGLSGYWPLDDVKHSDGPLDRVREVRGKRIGQPVPVDDDALPLYPPKLVEGIRFGSAAPEQFTRAWTRKLIPRDSERFVVEAWVRPGRVDASSPTQRLVPQRAQSDMQPVVSQHGLNTGWELRTGQHAEFMIALDHRYTRVRSIAPLQRDVWQHLLAVYDRASLTLYVNGIRDTALAVSGAPTWYDGPLSIGCNPQFPDHLYHGMLGDVRVWSDALAEPSRLVGSVMWEGVSPEDPGPRVQFRFGGVVVRDEAARASIEEAGLVLERFEAPPVRLQNPGEAIVLEPDPEVPEVRPVNGVTPSESIGALRARHERALQDIERLESSNAALSEELTALRETLKARDERDEAREKSSLTLDRFVRDTQARIDKVRKDTASGGNYRLGRVTIQARVLPGEDGATIRFPEHGSAVDGALLSTIDLEFDSAASEAVASGATVPDVLGYTEPKARRELVEAGFTVEISYQAVTRIEDRDRVVEQIPHREESMQEPGTTVTVFIGKQSDSVES